MKKIILFAFLILLTNGCGLKKTTSERFLQSSPILSSSQDGNADTICAGKKGIECFNLVIWPDLQENCIVCHRPSENRIAGQGFVLGDQFSYYDALSKFIGSDADKLDNWLRGEHREKAGSIAEPSAIDIRTWLVAQGVAKPSDAIEDDDKAIIVEPDPTEEGGGNDCTTARECFDTLISPAYGDCMGCHHQDGTRISRRRVANGSYENFGEALKRFIGNTRDSLHNKLRQLNGVTHGGGPQGRPAKVDIDKWLDAEGIN